MPRKRSYSDGQVIDQSRTSLFGFTPQRMEIVQPINDPQEDVIIKNPNHHSNLSQKERLRIIKEDKFIDLALSTCFTETFHIYDESSYYIPSGRNVQWALINSIEEHRVQAKVNLKHRFATFQRKLSAAVDAVFMKIFETQAFQSKMEALITGRPDLYLRKSHFLAYFSFYFFSYNYAVHLDQKKVI